MVSLTTTNSNVFRTSTALTLTNTSNILFWTIWIISVVIFVLIILFLIFYQRKSYWVQRVYNLRKIHFKKNNNSAIIAFSKINHDISIVPINTCFQNSTTITSYKNEFIKNSNEPNQEKDTEIPKIQNKQYFALDDE